jgi:selenocysteine lyase/cysteine desulfurase
VNQDRFPAVLSAAAHGRVLVDNAAGAQLPDRALERLQRYLTYDNAQRGSVFARTEATNELVEEAKRECAALIGAPVERVGTGLNSSTLAFAFARLVAASIRSGDRIVVTAADHEANVAPWMWLRRFGAQVHVVPVDRHGDLDEEKYRLLLASEPVLVALPWASNATGTVYDVAALSRAAKAAGATVVVDGVQAFPHFPLEIPRSVDFVFFSAYKCYAPHLAFWYLSEGAFERFVRADDERIPSDARYWTLETGTQSYEALAGWLGTVEYLRDIAPEPRRALAAIARYEADLSEYTRLAFAERAERVTLYGRPASDGRLPVFAFNVAGVAGEEIARRLEAAGIEARLGDYYAPRLMQTLAPDFAGRALRISLAHYNTREDVERCFAVIDGVAG